MLYFKNPSCWVMWRANSLLLGWIPATLLRLLSLLLFQCMMEEETPAAAAVAAAPVAPPIRAGGGAARPGDGWAHVKLSHDASMKPSWTCNYCNKAHNGESHTRIIEHLAGKKGNVSPCSAVPPAVQVQFQTIIDAKETADH